jgi:CheY-like chemotaxis protein
MIEPLALVLYERILPGTQIVSRLQDLRYRVKTLNDPTLLPSTAATDKAMLVLADFEPRPDRVREAVARLKSDPATQHIPVIVFAGDASVKRELPSVEGATLVVSETAILNHLPQLLEQALQVE